MKRYRVLGATFGAVAAIIGGWCWMRSVERAVSLDPDAAIESAALPPNDELMALRLTYPTGHFDPSWALEAAKQEALIASAVPAGNKLLRSQLSSALALDPNAFTPLGPHPLNNSQESYGHVSGRVNALIADPVDNSVAYLASDGGGVWKTTNCCDANTTWTVTTDIPQVASMAIDDIAIDPNDHNTVYAATGDLNYGSFSFGSAGVLKSTDQGNTWTLLGATVFTPVYLPATTPNSSQYQAISKIVVDPNNSSVLAAGTKTGVYFSYDAGTNWSGPCYTNTFTSGAGAQRQDITGLVAVNNAGSTTLYAAVGVRGTPTPIQPDLGNNGANAVYRTPMPTSGCPAVAAWTLLNNGWPAGTGNGTPSNRGRIELAVAPSDSQVLYAEVADATNRNVLGVFRTGDGGNNWAAQATSSNVASCGDSNSAGGGTQMWYDAHLLVHPTDPDTVWLSGFDLFRSSNGGANFSNVTCGWTTAPAGTIDHVHVDHHAAAFVGSNPDKLLIGSDGGVFYSANATSATPGFKELNDSLNTIEIYSGDITGNFATSATPGAAGGFQDNGSAVVTYNGAPGLALWQEVGAGDGMFSRIEPVLGKNWYYSVYYGQINQSVQGDDGSSNGANYTPDEGAWGTPLLGASGQACDNTTDPVNKDRKSFLMPFDIYRYGDTAVPLSGCDAVNGCTHLIAGSCRVWETTTGHFSNSAAVTGDLTKGNLVVGTDNRSYINQIHYSFSDATVAIAGTSDGNVQYIYNLGTGASATAVNVTGNNTVLPNRQVLNVATDPANPWIGYAAMGGFDQNTPTTPGHVFKVTCTNTPPPLGSNCVSFTWENKTGNLPNIPVGAILPNPHLPQQVFAGTDWGLYFTNDITAANPTWYRFEGLPHVMIWDMVIDRGFTTLAVFTRSRGAWVWPLPSAAVSPGADASVQISADAGVVAGASYIATITVGNNGPDSATGVQLSAPAPTGTMLGTVGGDCAALPCALGDIASGASKVVTVTYTVSSSYAGGPIVTSASVSSSNKDNASTNNNASANTAVSFSADLAAGVSGASAAVAGTQVSYTATLSNAGPSDAAGASLDVPTPAGLSLVSVSGACASLPCDLGTLAAGAPAASITVTFAVPPGYSGPTPFSVQANGGSTTGDPQAANNTASTDTSVSASADLAVGLSAMPAAVVPGKRLSYVVTVSNSGFSTASNVSVDSPLPTGLSFVGTSGDCTGALPCQFASLDPGQVRTFTVTACAPAKYATNPAHFAASATSATADAVAANNAAGSDVPLDLDALFIDGFEACP